MPGRERWQASRPPAAVRCHTGSFACAWGTRAAEFAETVDPLPVQQHRLALLQRHQFSLDAAGDAFRRAAGKSSGALQVTVTP